MQQNNTLTAKLTNVIQEAPNQIALQIKTEDGYQKYTYQDLSTNLESIAQALIDHGIQKGDRVVISLENGPLWVFIYFGILFAGGIAVPLDPQSTEKDFAYFFKDSGCRAIFTTTKIKPKCVPKEVILFDETKIAEIIEHPKKLTVEIPVSSDDLASILYTSGTTGDPKGVMLTHANFYANFNSVKDLDIFKAHHNFLSILPLHHSFPFMVTLIIPLFLKDTVTYISTLKQADMLSAMQETGVTLLAGVPQFYRLFYQSITQEMKKIPFYIRWPLLGLINLFHQIRRFTHINLNKKLLGKIHKKFGGELKYFTCGGAKLDTEIEEFLVKIGFTIIQGYGLTETAPGDAFNPVEKQKIGSAGKSINDVEIKILNPNQDGIGEIIIKGPNVMKGYYNKPKETAEVLKDGWFYTGDLGYLDEDDYLFITGRQKELIVLGSGKNITPEEVEHHYGKSKYIKEICVLAMKKNGEEKLGAVILPDLDYFKQAGEINIKGAIKWDIDLLSRDYPAYKQIMDFMLIKDPLPKTRLSKLKRHEIQARYGESFTGEKVIENEEALSDTDLSILSSDIYKITAQIIQEEKQLEEPINLNDHLGIDLGFDSLSRIELIATLERQFNIQISEMISASVATVKELVVALSQLIKEQKPDLAKAFTLHSKETLWKDLLQPEPKKEITEKIELHPSRCARSFIRGFCKSLHFILKSSCNIKANGKENLPKEGAFLLCPNHTSFLDAFIVGAASPKHIRDRFYFLGFSHFFDVPIIRNLVKLGRIIPLDSNNKLIDAMQGCAYLLKNDKAVCLFPEGGRSPDGSLLPFKKGVGILAKEINVPIVPVYIEGAFDVLPRGKSWPKRHPIKITFGKPYTPDELEKIGEALGAKTDYEAIAAGLREKLKNLI